MSVDIGSDARFNTFATTRALLLASVDELIATLRACSSAELLAGRVAHCLRLGR